ncbi:MAG: hypothetical protein COB36_03280 [Alphaproteobacteria bacterium]|nr:MAG: hypothetical protein COB36_03280 [Alphaproteobacteria bacterium]
MADFPPLSSAIRNNLLASYKTQRLIDDTTLRLASGLDVSSALDNPDNFFTSKALKFRADDLSRRLDGMAQSIRALEEADNGIQASLELLDLADSYLLDMLERYNAGEFEFADGAPINITPIRPNAGDFIGYAGSQDSGAPVTVTNDGEDFTLAGNLWKRLFIDYTITPDTVLEFEYASTTTPEISAIGFDNDSAFNNDSDRFFLNGTQFIGVPYSASIPTYQYTGAGAYQSYSIPVGAFFTGNFDYITFINDDDLTPTGNAMFRNVSLREGPIELAPPAAAPLQEGYEYILKQLNQLAEDAHYRGIQLLKDENLEVIFNENGSSKLLIEGINGSANGLGLLSGDLNSIKAIEEEIDEIKKAREILRAFGTTIASDLGIIQTRQTFTRATINTLLRGADDLTVADQNEEGANLLALQTRQTLGQTALSLSLQGAGSILNLFA